MTRRGGADLPIQERPSPNWDARPQGMPIDMLILHYTGMPSAQAALDRLCDPAARVSSHYVVDEDGAVWRLVDERRRAWHAGVSCWRGQATLNDRSVGIEIVNPGHEWGYRPFPALQMAALCELCLGIQGRHPIPARNVADAVDDVPAALRAIGYGEGDLATTLRAFQRHWLPGAISGQADGATRARLHAVVAAVG